jgi:5-(carboxyamino)imidazole ribonucleotide synthase
MIEPPATIGVLGGGQLGRYAVLAARRLGYSTVVLEPDPDAPAGREADTHLVAAYDDPDALDRLATSCAVVTTEFENPPADALARLAGSTLVRPSPDAVAVAQDRRTEKRFLADAKVPVGRLAVIDGPEDLAHATMAVQFPAVLKTARLGYDGKGQAQVVSSDELAAAWESLGSVPCVLEERLRLQVEVSVVLARTADGEIATYPVTENAHVDGILDVSIVPARIDAALADEARSLAARVAEALGYVGVLAVEMFVVGGRLLVNELAPRPHNSGHWTLDAAVTSQFEQQVRAVCGLALGPTGMTAPAAAMANLLGDLWPTEGEPPWHLVVDEPGVHLHLYGKRESRPGRKMGHLTVVGDDPTRCAGQVIELRQRLDCRLGGQR